MRITETTENGGIISYSIFPQEPDLESLTKEHLAQLIADSWFLKRLIRDGVHEWDGARLSIDLFYDDLCFADGVPCFSGISEFTGKVNAHIEAKKTMAVDGRHDFVAIEKDQLKILEEQDRLFYSLLRFGVKEWPGYEKAFKYMNDQQNIEWDAI